MSRFHLISVKLLDAAAPHAAQHAAEFCSTRSGDVECSVMHRVGTTEMQDTTTTTTTTITTTIIIHPPASQIQKLLEPLSLQPPPKRVHHVASQDKGRPDQHQYQRVSAQLYNGKRVDELIEYAHLSLLTPNLYLIQTLRNQHVFRSPNHRKKEASSCCDTDVLDVAEDVPKINVKELPGVA